MIATGSLLLSLSIAAATVSAQGSSSLTGGLSTSCTTAATGLISGDIASCANIIGLVGVVSATGSVVTPLNNWINSICTSNPCSTSTLSAAASQISQGCATDIKNGQATANALNVILTQYPLVRDTLCLQASSNNTYCVTNLLTDVQKANGSDITVASVESLLTAGTGGLLADLGKLPPSTYCTDCFKAITIDAAQITANVSSASSATSLTSAVAGQCGASFGDGKMPSTVKQSASGSSSGSTPSGSSSSKPSAASAVSFNGGLFVGLTAVAGAVLAGAAAIAM